MVNTISNIKTTPFIVFCLCNLEMETKNCDQGVAHRKLKQYYTKA